MFFRLEMYLIEMSIPSLRAGSPKLCEIGAKRWAVLRRRPKTKLGSLFAG